MTAPTTFSSFEGRCVLVTGGTRGLGKAMARAFLRAGARVAISGRDERAGAAAVAALADAGEPVFIAADVALPADVERLVAEAQARCGGLDVLCANAGIYPKASLAELDAAAVDEMFAVNVRSTILTVKAAAPALAASGSGRVVVTSSVTGPITGEVGWSHYGASKSAQVGFVRSAAIELAGDGITVNAVLPGNIALEEQPPPTPELEARVRAGIPAQRLGTPEEVAAVALFLASEEASFVTGQTLVVDGGQTLPEWSLNTW